MKAGPHFAKIVEKILDKKLDGILYFDLDFFRLTFLQKYLVFIKFGVCLAFALLLALALAFLGGLFGN